MLSEGASSGGPRREGRCCDPGPTRSGREPPSLDTGLGTFFMHYLGGGVDSASPCSGGRTQGTENRIALSGCRQGRGIVPTFRCLALLGCRTPAPQNRRCSPPPQTRALTFEKCREAGARGYGIRKSRDPKRLQLPILERPLCSSFLICKELGLQALSGALSSSATLWPCSLGGRHTSSGAHSAQPPRALPCLAAACCRWAVSPSGVHAGLQ